MIKKIFQKVKSFKYLDYCILISFVLMISAPLLYNGMIHGHDLRFHMSRIISISEGINNGDFLSYIHSGYLNNYGYANGLFYSNIFLYIPAIIKSLGFNIINSYKIFLILCNLATIISMYYCINRITQNKRISLISSILYLMNPYRVCDMYIRAAIGEVLAFIFVPFVLLGIYDFISNNGKKWWYLAIGFTGLILSHLLSSIIMFILTFILFLVYYKKLLNKKTIKNLVLAVIVCILFVSFYVFPMLEQYLNTKFVVNTNTVNSNISGNTIPILKVFSAIPHWYNGIFIPSGIGFLLLYLLILRTKIKKFKLQKICDISIIIGIISILCVTDFIPWHSLSFLAILQFPWRIYICAVPFLIIAASIILNEYSFVKYKKHSQVFICFILILSVIAPAYMIYNHYKTEYVWRDYYDYNLGGKEYIPDGVNIDQLKERGEIVTSNNDIIIDFNRIKNKVIVDYSNNNFDNTYIELPLLYYKGYYVTNDLKIESGENGVVRVYLTKESDTITIFYKGTKVANASLVMTIIFAFGLPFICLVKVVKKVWKKIKYPL